MSLVFTICIGNSLLDLRARKAPSPSGQARLVAGLVVQRLFRFICCRLESVFGTPQVLMTTH